VCFSALLFHSTHLSLSNLESLIFRDGVLTLRKGILEDLLFRDEFLEGFLFGDGALKGLSTEVLLFRNGLLEGFLFPSGVFAFASVTFGIFVDCGRCWFASAAYVHSLKQLVRVYLRGALIKRYAGGRFRF